MKLFIETSMDGEDVLNVSTVQQGSILVEVELVDSALQVDKLKGYTVEPLPNGSCQMKFDKGKFDSYMAEREKEQALKDGKKLIEELAKDSVLKSASDSEAFVMRFLYDTWNADKLYKVGERVQYKDLLYKCKQEHTSQLQHTPELIPAIWDVVNGDSSKGTLENPIPVPDPFSSMVYVKGKYYIENGKVYLMNRTGMQDGEEISLAYKPSALVGQYFKVVGVEDSESQLAPEFKQPTGAHDAYKKGDCVMFNGKKYESLIDSNVYSPTAYPQGWKEVV